MKHPHTEQEDWRAYTIQKWASVTGSVLGPAAWPLWAKHNPVEQKTGHDLGRRPLPGIPCPLWRGLGRD